MFSPSKQTSFNKSISHTCFLQIKCSRAHSVSTHFGNDTVQKKTGQARGTAAK